ncbi:MAG: hypothetical protein ACF8QF_08925 [Phycisphaerales bacterium]
MSSSTQTDALAGFLSSLPKADPATATPIDAGADPIDELVWSMLLWDAPQAKAERAHKRIVTTIVDVNELRVCMPDEVVGLIGKSYPNVAERAERLLRTLHEIYLREHAVTLGTLRSAPKRDAKKYLDSLEAAPQFVTGRVLLLALGAHAIPLDARMHTGLRAAGAVEDDADEARAVSLLERAVKASDAVAVHASMLQWAEGGKGSKAKSTARKSSGRKKTAKSK